LKIGFILFSVLILTAIFVWQSSLAATPGPTRTSGDLELLARVIRGEEEAEPYNRQVAVGPGNHKSRQN
jgi:hypothetical protein